MIAVIMEFEPSLVVIPYPGGVESHKGRPFAHEATISVSSYRCEVYTNELFIAEGKPTTVKVFVGHDLAAVIFNSLELALLADEKEGVIRVCFIQASRVVVAGYLNGSTKIMDVIHWTKHYNCLPCLRSMDIEVKMLNIKDPTGEPQKYNYRNQVIAAHILCVEKDEEEVKTQFGNTYCKERKSSRAAGEIPEGRAMRYVPYKNTGVITQCPKRFAKLQKKQTNAPMLPKATSFHSFLRFPQHL